MHLIVCLDDDNGMAFNRRRQSRDSEVCRRIAERAAGHRLWMSPYSEPLFEGLTADIAADEAFCERAGAGDFCFAEQADIAPLLPQAESVTVYRWNRKYPSDVVCTADFSAWTLQSREEFPGHSHDTITEEVYTR